MRETLQFRRQSAGKNYRGGNMEYLVLYEFKNDYLRECVSNGGRLWEVIEANTKEEARKKVEEDKLPAWGNLRIAYIIPSPKG
jgi:uncharacterized lipoprotein YehR (DUF1307 family)